MIRRAHKYGAVRTEVNGINFSSKSEARRYNDLLMMERAKLIKDLKLQERFPLRVNDIRVGTYVADFSYFDLHDKCQVVEDVKGVVTKLYTLKKALMKAIHGIEIREIGGPALPNRRSASA